MAFNSKKLYVIAMDKVITILKEKLEKYLQDDEVGSLYEVIIIVLFSVNMTIFVKV